MLTLLLLFFASLLAFWLSAITGGGASMLVVPVLSQLVPLSLVPFSLTLGTFTSSISRIIVFKKKVCWRIVAWFVPFSIPAVLLGAYFVKLVNPVYLQVLVALLLLANLRALFKTKQAQKAERASSTFTLAMVGFLAGLVSGITGAIGLLFNRFYLQYGLTKEEIIATRAANEMLLHLVKLVVYLLIGLYSHTAFVFGSCIAVAAIVSSLTIKYILPHLSELLFRKIGYGAMVAAGSFLLIGSVTQIIKEDKVSVINSTDGTTLETAVRWRSTAFVLEFTIDEGLEVERPITYSELPTHLQHNYDSLQVKYQRIQLEKVFTLGEAPAYEFYCFRNQQLTKLEFESEE